MAARCPRLFINSKELLSLLPPPWPPPPLLPPPPFNSKEFSLERVLDKMQGEWAGMKLEYTAWRDTGTYVLRALTEVQVRVRVRVRVCVCDCVCVGGASV